MTIRANRAEVATFLRCVADLANTNRGGFVATAMALDIDMHDPVYGAAYDAFLATLNLLPDEWSDAFTASRLLLPGESMTTLLRDVALHAAAFVEEGEF